MAGLLNSNQSAITDAYRYDPFGVSLATQGTSVNPYRFQGRLLESTSGQYDFGARQYDPAIGAFTSLDTLIGQAQNPLSLNRYLYAHANPLVMIDLDGHAAKRGGGSGGPSPATAVADARAAVTAARTALNSARATYSRTAAAASLARGRLSQLCPLSFCRDGQDRAEWRQSHLDAYAAAVTLRDQARARYDAAATAYASAEAHLRAAEANLAKGAKPKPVVRAMDPSSTRPGSAWSRAVAPAPKDEGIGGFLHGALDLVGMIPIIGEPADLLNAGIYAAEGEFVNAGISAASAIPLVGNVVGVGKLAVKYGDDAVALVAKKGDEIAAAAKPGPKPWPSGPHNQRISSRVGELEDRGYVHVGGGSLTEQVIPIPPGGYKASRRPDISMTGPNGQAYYENVGLTYANGLPIRREAEAIADFSLAGYPIQFTPYVRRRP